MSVKQFLGIGGAEETLNLDYIFDTFRDRIPAWFFPVARDPGGDLIGIASEGARTGKVYLWDHETEAEDGEPPIDGNLLLVANTFEAFLASLHE